MKKNIIVLLLVSLALPFSLFAQYKTTGSIERLNSSLDKVIDIESKAEIIAEGFDWSEGPLWIAKYNMLLFSDVPKNTIYKWTAAKGTEVYLTPSGFSG
ncbi:MAG: SMP-30/gluconolactonase/LRE family protein, partial [Sediminibacterium sp.]